jgi:hypothetical protein
MLGELIECFERENLTPGRKYHLFHIFAANAETSPSYAGDDLILWVFYGSTGETQFTEMLNPRHLVASRAVIFGDLRFNDNLRIELAVGIGDVLHIFSFMENDKTFPL